MLGSFRHYLAGDEVASSAPNEEPTGGRAFNGIRTRASKTLDNFNLGLPSISSWRELTFGSPGRTHGSGTPETSSHLARQSRSDEPVVTRMRSRSSPAEPQQSLRRRAIQFRDTALLDLRARANLNRLPSLMPSFHFSLPFSDSSSIVRSKDDTVDDAIDYQRDSDNTSMTSLEIEALATDLKAENNRLRGIIEGLPKLGLPKSNGDEPFAGLSSETKDLNIVVLGGYRGSILRSAEDGRMLWVPMKVGLGIRKVDLELSLDEAAEQDSEKIIRADGMLTNIGPVDISRRLLNRLRAMEEREYCKVHEFGYDWRLGGQYLSDKLIAFLESLSGRVLVIAHSLGGLISLHALNRRPELFRGILFAGTPFHGCPNILGPFRYGDGVLLNKSVLNARTNFSMRSSFMLLPTHKRCFVDIATGKELPVDLFDVAAWREYGLSPMVADDHGQGDVGESTDVNGMFASGGVAGPSMGHSADDANDGLLDAVPQANSSTRDGGSTKNSGSRGKSKAEDRAYREEAQRYLQTVLQSTLDFRQGLAHRPDTSYPPIALLRASGTQTVRGCSVHGYDGIKEGDYSRFIFSPGDGVVTFASADLATLDIPQDLDDLHKSGGWGKHIVEDVENDRGHIGLLGDLAGVATCMQAILRAPIGIQHDVDHDDDDDGTHSLDTPLEPPIVGVIGESMLIQ